MEVIASCPHEIAGFVMRIKQRLDASAKIDVGTGLQQESFSFRWIGASNRLVEEELFSVGCFLHGGGSVLIEEWIRVPNKTKKTAKNAKAAKKKAWEFIAFLGVRGALAVGFFRRSVPSTGCVPLTHAILARQISQKSLK
jgi:hypothetical protein